MDYMDYMDYKTLGGKDAMQLLKKVCEFKTQFKSC